MAYINRVTTSELFERVNGLRSRRTPFVLATVVRAERPTSAKPGDCALVLPDGSMEGFVGGACAESTVRLEGLRLLRAGESTLLRITPNAADDGSSDTEEVEGLVTVDNPCLSGGTLEIFLEAMIPPTLVHVFGDAPVARALVKLGAALDYDVHSATDPKAEIAPDTVAVVVASHGRDEESVLAGALRAGVPYVALVASPKRSAAVLAGLDVDDEQRQRVRAPAGLDIGARGAAEIALSVFADLIARRPQPPPPALNADAPAATPTEAIDPVCGMTVAVSTESLSLHQLGKDWYFCGTGCRQAFADDPARYRFGEG
ncbi:MAG: XshC-Cox1-family protein [Pseudonocardia sp.]|nr:XshC-Cox1-family protein [Pseudonocardia sp.]